jgi:hypothetical protein
MYFFPVFRTLIFHDHRMTEFVFEIDLIRMDFVSKKVALLQRN